MLFQLKKVKNLSALIIGAILASSIALSAYATICPYDSDYKFVLKKALTDYYSNPQASELQPSEISSLLDFYLSKESITDIECSQDINALVDKADNTIPDRILSGLSGTMKETCYVCPDGAVCDEQNAKGQTCTCKDVNNDGQSEYCYLKPIIPPIQTCEICPDGTLCDEENEKGQTCTCKDVNNDGQSEYCVLKPLEPGSTTTTTEETTSTESPTTTGETTTTVEPTTTFSSTTTSSTTSTTTTTPQNGCPNPVMPIRSLPGISSVSVVEQTGGYSTNTYPLNMVYLNYGSIDLWTSAQELYDFYISDSEGSPNPQGSYITSLCKRSIHIGGIRSGHNIDSISLNRGERDQKLYADYVAGYELGVSPYGTGYYQNILGRTDGRVTYLGDGTSRITVGFCNALKTSATTTTTSTITTTSTTNPTNPTTTTTITTTTTTNPTAPTTTTTIITTTTTNPTNPTTTTTTRITTTTTSATTSTTKPTTTTTIKPTTTTTTTAVTTTTTETDDCQSDTDCIQWYGGCYKCPTKGGDCVQGSTNCQTNNDCTSYGADWECNSDKCCVPIDNCQSDTDCITWYGGCYTCPTKGGDCVQGSTNCQTNNDCTHFGTGWTCDDSQCCVPPASAFQTSRNRHF